MDFNEHLSITGSESFITQDPDGKIIHLVRAEAFDKAVRDLTDARTALRQEQANVLSMSQKYQEARVEAARLARELAYERSLRGPSSQSSPFRRAKKW
jgi:hypothetical protein